MQKEVKMLIRYAVIAFVMFNYGAGSPLITPLADVAVAAVAVLWGMWDRWIEPWFTNKVEEVKENL